MLVDTYKDNFVFKGFDGADIRNKINTFVSLLHDPVIIESLQTIFESFMATSELQVLKRITAIEEKLGIIESDVPTIPQKLIEIEVKVNAITEGKKPKFELFKSLPTTITDTRTDFLIKHLWESEDVPKIPDCSRSIERPYINSREFKNFVTHILPEKLRPKSFKNLRKIKKDLFENAAMRYGNKVIIDKSKHGNKELRLVALPCVTT